MFLRLISSVIIVFICFGSIQAQNSMAFSIKAYETKADFHKNVNALPVGFSFSYLRSIEESRFSYGGEFGVAMYNNETINVTENGTTFQVDEEDCFLTFHAFLRYDMYENNWSKVYAEARMGATTFFSSRIAEDYESDFESDFDFHGTAFNTGFGGGLLVNPASVFNKEEGGDFWLDFGVSFNSGSKANYRMAPEGNGNYSIQDGKYRSLTHYVAYRVGFLVNF